MDDRQPPGREEDAASLHYRVSIPVKGGKEFIDYRSIHYCEASRNSSYIYLLTAKELRKITCCRPLCYLEKTLNKKMFGRVHESYMVNINHCCGFDHIGKDGVVRLSTGIKLPVSRTYKKIFLTMIPDLH